MFLHKKAILGTNKPTPSVISQMIVKHYGMALIPSPFIIIALAFLLGFGVGSTDLQNRSQYRPIPMNLGLTSHNSRQFWCVALRVNLGGIGFLCLLRGT